MICGFSSVFPDSYVAERSDHVFPRDWFDSKADVALTRHHFLGLFSDSRYLADISEGIPASENVSRCIKLELAPVAHAFSIESLLEPIQMFSSAKSACFPIHWNKIDGQDDPRAR